MDDTISDNLLPYLVPDFGWELHEVDWLETSVGRHIRPICVRKCSTVPVYEGLCRGGKIGYFACLDGATFIYRRDSMRRSPSSFAKFVSFDGNL